VIPAEIRASTLHKLMNCLGYYSLNNINESEAGDAAKEGTACGELLSAMIMQQTDKPQVDRVASNGVIFDDDMWFYAKETYHDVLKSAQGSPISTEVRVDWMGGKSGIKIRGQYDISYIVGDTLYVEDLKYGFGIVDVERNWQLIAYAIGLCFMYDSNYKWRPNKIHFKIHQPRPYHEQGKIRSWVITHDELIGLHGEITNRLTALVSGDKTLSTTLKSCKYCEGAAECPALNRSFYKSVHTVMQDWEDKELTNDELSDLLATYENIKSLVDIKGKSLQNLAIARLQKGQVINGYAYEQKFGDRKWRDDVDPSLIQMMTGIDIIKPTVLSPAQAEKAGVHKSIIAGMVTKPSKGLDLVKSNNLEKARKIFGG